MSGVRIRQHPVAPDQIFIDDRSEFGGVKWITVTRIGDVDLQFLSSLQTRYVGDDVRPSNTVEQLLAIGESVDDIAGEQCTAFSVVRADAARTMTKKMQRNDLAISKVNFVPILQRQSFSNR